MKKKYFFGGLVRHNFGHCANRMGDDGSEDSHSEPHINSQNSSINDIPDRYTIIPSKANTLGDHGIGFEPSDGKAQSDGRVVWADIYDRGSDYSSPDISDPGD